MKILNLSENKSSVMATYAQIQEWIRKIIIFHQKHAGSLM
jgi:hypothetical protein